MRIEDLFYEERLTDNEEHMRLVSGFTCGTNDSLDQFLKSEAFEYNKTGEGNTYIIRKTDTGKLIAYYTLKANNIPLYSVEKNKIYSLPAVELARLAVSYDLQFNGYGKLIFVDKIISKINDVKELIGINTLMLFAVNDSSAIKFYKRLGFEMGKEEVQKFVKDDYNEGCKIMYMSTGKLNEFEQEFNKIVNKE